MDILNRSMLPIVRLLMLDLIPQLRMQGFAKAIQLKMVVVYGFYLIILLGHQILPTKVSVKARKGRFAGLDHS